MLVLDIPMPGCITLGRVSYHRGKFLPLACRLTKQNVFYLKAFVLSSDLRHEWNVLWTRCIAFAVSV